jgi:hypothetical protein
MLLESHTLPSRIKPWLARFVPYFVSDTIAIAIHRFQILSGGKKPPLPNIASIEKRTANSLPILTQSGNGMHAAPPPPALNTPPTELIEFTAAIKFTVDI